MNSKIAFVMVICVVLSTANGDGPPEARGGHGRGRGRGNGPRNTQNKPSANGIVKSSPQIPTSTAKPNSCLMKHNDATFCARLAMPADRTYYVAAKEIEWDYAPGGNLLSLTPNGKLFPSDVYLVNGPQTIGSKYLKAVYRAYLSENFETEKAREAGFEHAGVSGPVLRGFVGETIKIVFYNNASFTTNFHAHGVVYDKYSEAAPYNDGSIPGDQIVPQQKYVYFWKLRERMVDRYSSSKMWVYHSHLDEIAQITAGLYGPLIVTKRVEDSLVPSDIDREVASFFIVMDESNSVLFNKNIERYMNASGNLTAPQKVALLADPVFIEGNVMHAINGYAFGNALPLNAKYNDRIRWYLGTFGNEKDGPHTVHWHGNVVTHLDESVDVVMMLPASTATVDMVADARGEWLYHCHVYDHISAGMISTYSIH